MKNWKLYSLITISIILLATILIGTYVWTYKFDREEIHIHAGFKIYKNNELLDLSGVKHMYFLPCGTADGEKAKIELKDMVHLHNGIGDVAHIHYTKVTWSELLTSLEIEYEKVQIFGVDRQELGLDEVIGNYDSVAIFVDENEDLEQVEILNNLVTQEKILEVEQSVENCGP